jgi:hypothetical protein
VRDAVERNAVEEAVDQPMRVVAAHQILNRLRFGEEITDRRSAMLGLRATDPDSHSTGDYWIVPRDNDRVIAVERFAEALARALPVEGSPRLGGSHGDPG